MPTLIGQNLIKDNLFPFKIKSNNILLSILSTSIFILYSCAPINPQHFAYPTGSPASDQNLPLDTYHVSTTGSDSNPGTQALPLLTIQKAVSKSKPGNVIIVEAGSYNQPVIINKSGTSSAPIAYKANGKVITKGFTIDASYVTISNFEITDNLSGSSDWGVYITGSYNVIEDNFIHDLEWGGVLLEANVSDPTLTTNNLIQNNKIYHVGQVGVDVRGRNNIVLHNDISATMQYVPSVSTPPSWVDADGIHIHGQGHIIRGNFIHDISYTQPENRDPHIDCFQTFSSPPSQEAASNVLFDGNYCDEPSQTNELAAKLIQAEDANNLTFINNISYVYLVGIVKSSTNISFLNNTFVAPDPNGQGLQLISDQGITIQNNIFANQSNGIGAIFPDLSTNLSLVAGNNCIWNQGSNRIDPGDVVGADPLFVKPENDFHLQVGSPCIDKGLSLANVPKDFDGTSRPQGQGYDMGAYEFVVSP
jgi:hypothetical protein